MTLGFSLSNDIGEFCNFTQITFPLCLPESQIVSQPGKGTRGRPK